MDRIPGVEDVLHDVVQVEHSVAALTDLFSGASVVCNTVGPSIQAFGHRELLGALRSFGLVMEPVLTVEG